MNEVQLPQLPEKEYLGDDCSYGYDSESMLLYGRACYEAGRQQRGGGMGVCVVNCADHYSVEFMGGGVIRKFPHEDYACAAYFAQGYRAALAAQPDPNVRYGDGFHNGYWKGREEGWDAAMAAQPAASAEPVEVTDAMALAFHSAMTDGAIGQGDVDEIKIGLRAALATHKPAGGDAKDAERYRWLRVQPFEVWKRIAWNTWDDDPTVATQRDADIDTVISAQQRHGEGGSDGADGGTRTPLGTPG